MESLWYSAYKKVKAIPVLGYVAQWARDVYRFPYFERKRLLAQDVAHAQAIAQQLFGDRGVNYVRHFYSSTLFKKQFSFGNSGDFDVLILYALVRALKPDVVVETGVASGRSSSAILQGLTDNQRGALYSIDLPQEYEAERPETYITHEGNQELKGFVPKGKEPGWLVPDELRERWTLVLGNSNAELPKLLSKLDHVDLFYHDGDHSFQSMAFEFATLWPQLPQGGVVCSDDIDWNDAWKEFVAREKPTSVHTYRHFGIAVK